MKIKTTAIEIECTAMDEFEMWEVSDGISI